MNTLNETLIHLGMSKNEAHIYEILSMKPGLTVYQIAMELQLSRSSVYPLVEGMVRNGYLVLSKEDKDKYHALDKETLLKMLSSRHQVALEEASKMLDELPIVSERESTVNVVGYETILAKAKTMIESAQNEIIMNTDLDIEVFHNDLEQALQREVRVILFSFRKQTTTLPIEIYSHDYVIQEANRLMLVIDEDKTLAASVTPTRDEWLGIVSNNPFLVRLHSEHIHHDIYLLKFREKLGKNLFELHPDIFLGTRNERGVRHGKKPIEK
ncbi:MAG: TrmB family transcriptional regulator [Candidatus Izemoplasmatales bacterium]